MDELGFYVPSTVFQSFRDDGRVNIKGSVQWSAVWVQEESRLQRDSNPQPRDPKSAALTARPCGRFGPDNNLLMLGYIFEYINLYLWSQILRKSDVNQIWLTTWLFVYVPESGHKTDASEKKVCFVGWHVELGMAVSFSHLYPNSFKHYIMLIRQ